MGARCVAAQQPGEFDRRRRSVSEEMGRQTSERICRKNDQRQAFCRNQKSGVSTNVIRTSVPGDDYDTAESGSRRKEENKSKNHWS